MTTTVIMPGIRQIRQTHQNNGSKKTSAELPPPLLPVPGQKDACFKSACLLAHLIEMGLESERVHYRTKEGVLLVTLDEIIRAIITDELMIPE